MALHFIHSNQIPSHLVTLPAHLAYLPPCKTVYVKASDLRVSIDNHGYLPKETEFQTEKDLSHPLKVER